MTSLYPPRTCVEKTASTKEQQVLRNAPSLTRTYRDSESTVTSPKYPKCLYKIISNTTFTIWYYLNEKMCKLCDLKLFLPVWGCTHQAVLVPKPESTNSCRSSIPQRASKSCSELPARQRLRFSVLLCGFPQPITKSISQSLKTTAYMGWSLLSLQWMMEH